MQYQVQKGDTLWDLSRKFKIPLQDLMRQVPESVRRDPRTWMPGMTLNVPGQVPQTRGAARPYDNSVPYDVVQGRENRQLADAARARGLIPPEEKPSAFSRAMREAPSEIMKMIQGAPPTAMARGIGAGANYLTRPGVVNRTLENIGGAIERPVAAAYNKLGDWSQFDTLCQHN